MSDIDRRLSFGRATIFSFYRKVDNHYLDQLLKDELQILRSGQGMQEHPFNNLFAK